MRFRKQNIFSTVCRYFVINLSCSWFQYPPKMNVLWKFLFVSVFLLNHSVASELRKNKIATWYIVRPLLVPSL